jgi:RNA polymerase sigma-70 factor (ECF subfamily)
MADAGSVTRWFGQLQTGDRDAVQQLWERYFRSWSGWLPKAVRATRPGNVRQFFALANQHMRWGLNDLARRLVEQPRAVDLREESLLASSSSDSGLTRKPPHPGGDWRVTGAREALDLVRIQGMSQAEAARLLENPVVTVKRRLNRGPQPLAATLGDPHPGDEDPDAS